MAVPLILIDMDAHTTFGYAMNKEEALTTVGDARAMAMAKTMWAAMAA